MGKTNTWEPFLNLFYNPIKIVIFRQKLARDRMSRHSMSFNASGIDCRFQKFATESSRMCDRRWILCPCLEIACAFAFLLCSMIKWRCMIWSNDDIWLYDLQHLRSQLSNNISAVRQVLLPLHSSWRIDCLLVCFVGLKHFRSTDHWDMGYGM